jgi:hypothetical protein
VTLTQHRQCGGGHQDRSAQVDVQLQVDVLRLELVDGPGDPDAGGVHQHVETPVPGAMLLDQAPAVLRLRNVGCDGMGAERLGGRLDLLGIPGGERQGEAVLAQHARDRETDARRASGDEGGLVHRGIFPSRKVRRRPCRTGRRGNRKAPPLPWKPRGNRMVPPWPFLFRAAGNRTGRRVVTTVNRRQSVDERLADP